MLETFWMGQERRIEGDRALPGQVGGAAHVYGFWRHETDTGMPMLGVVPIEEGLAMRPCILDRSEAVREVRAILEGLELRFGVRIVIGDVGTAMRLANVQIDQQFGDRLGTHAGAAIGMQGQAAGCDVLLCR